jgi:hypothetical protein
MIFKYFQKIFFKCFRSMFQVFHLSFFYMLQVLHGVLKIDRASVLDLHLVGVD